MPPNSTTGGDDLADIEDDSDFDFNPETPLKNRFGKSATTTTTTTTTTANRGLNGLSSASTSTSTSPPLFSYRSSPPMMNGVNSNGNYNYQQQPSSSSSSSMSSYKGSSMSSINNNNNSNSSFRINRMNGSATDLTSSVSIDDMLPTPRSADNNDSNLKELSTQLEAYKKENFDLKMRLFYMQENVNRVTTSQDFDIMSQNVDLQVKLSEKITELEEKDRMVLKLGSAIDQSKAKIEKLKKNQAGLEDTIRKQKDDIDALNDDIAQKQQHIELQQQQLVDQRLLAQQPPVIYEQVPVVSAPSTRVVTQYINDPKDMETINQQDHLINDLKLKNNDCLRQIQDLNRQVAEYRNHDKYIKQLEDNIKELKQKEEKLLDTIDQLKQDLLAEQMKPLPHQDNSAVYEKIRKLQELHIKDLEKQKELQNKLDSALKKLEALKEHYESLRGNYELLLDRYNQAKTQLEAATLRIIELESQLEQKDLDFSALQHDIDQLRHQHQLAMDQADVNHLNELNSKAHLITELRNQIKRIRIDNQISITNEQETSVQMLHTFEESINGFQHDIQELENQLILTQNDKQDLEAQITHALAEKDQLAQERDTLANLNSTLESQLEEMEKTLDEKIKAKEMIESSFNDLEKMYYNLTQETKEYWTKLQGQGNIDKLETAKQLSDLQSKLMIQNNRYKTLQDSYTQLETAKQAVEKQLEAAKHQLDQDSKSHANMLANKQALLDTVEKQYKSKLERLEKDFLDKLEQQQFSKNENTDHLLNEIKKQYKDTQKKDFISFGETMLRVLHALDGTINAPNTGDQEFIQSVEDIVYLKVNEWKKLYSQFQSTIKRIDLQHQSKLQDISDTITEKSNIIEQLELTLNNTIDDLNVNSQQQIDSQKTTQQHYQSQLNARENEIRILEIKITNLQNRIADLQSQSTDQQNTTIELQHQLTQKNQEISLKTNLINQMQKNEAQQNNNVHHLQQQLQQQQQHLQQLQQQQQQQQNNIVDLDNSFEDQRGGGDQDDDNQDQDRPQINYEWISNLIESLKEVQRDKDELVQKIGSVDHQIKTKKISNPSHELTVSKLAPRGEKKRRASQLPMTQPTNDQITELIQFLTSSSNIKNIDGTNYQSKINEVIKKEKEIREHNKLLSYELDDRTRKYNQLIEKIQERERKKKLKEQELKILQQQQQQQQRLQQEQKIRLEQQQRFEQQQRLEQQRLEQQQLLLKQQQSKTSSSSTVTKPRQPSSTTTSSSSSSTVNQSSSSTTTKISTRPVQTTSNSASSSKFVKPKTTSPILNSEKEKNEIRLSTIPLQQQFLVKETDQVHIEAKKQIENINKDLQILQKKFK